ncbi:hypothetical protein [Streptomyces europaeiscabiei]|uniref:hypothetical protein n=1 Tax=Streptomyces europaeiscabiei TaxID=146819 RepID=UPI002E199AF9
MSGIDWGTVPAWASTILTSGSLLLGFYILLRDRVKDERAEALKLICWSVDSADARRVHVLNLADRAFTHPYIIVAFEESDALASVGFATDRADVGGLFTLVDDRVVVIRPGEEIVRDIPRREQEAIQPIAVTFLDADGVVWTRELDGGHLTRRTSRGQYVIDPAVVDYPGAREKARQEKARLKKFRRRQKGRAELREARVQNAAASLGSRLGRIHAWMENERDLWRRPR